MVRFREHGDPIRDATRHAVAAAVLRHCGATADEIKLAAAVAWAELLDE